MSLRVELRGLSLSPKWAASIVELVERKGDFDGAGGWLAFCVLHDAAELN
jgi:hypothetical protein